MWRAWADVKRIGHVWLCAVPKCIISVAQRNGSVGGALLDAVDDDLAESLGRQHLHEELSYGKVPG